MVCLILGDVMNILLLDNRDSFTYNIVNLIRKVNNHSFEVISVDDINLQKVAFFDKIIFSPGPEIPEPEGIMKKILDKYAKSKSIFGICLGFQAIAQYYGAGLYNMETVYHGIQKDIYVKDPADRIFSGVPPVFKAGLYHSWAVISQSFPSELRITARLSDNIIMAYSHICLDICGVQFHPESYMTPFGEKILRNWLKE